jgi:hypothetical protein
MPRNIARIVKDLRPPVEMINSVAALLADMAGQLPEDKQKAVEFKECLRKLNRLTTTVQRYIDELDDEACKEGINC